jgi:CHAD domain-containing protein
VDEVTRRLQEARERIATWPVAGLDPEGVVAGFEKVYGRGYRRRAEAYDDPDDPAAAFHEWRKRAKYLWYHLRLLEEAWPELLEPRAEEQHGLTNLLGDANDLSDLLTLLDEEGEALLPDPATRDALTALCRRQRRLWWEEARPLGRRLYALAPDEMAARIHTLLLSREGMAA